MSVLDGLTGIVIVTVLGSIFLITCFISTIKAIRDRFRIKERRAMRHSIQSHQTSKHFIENNQNDVPISCSSQLQKSSIETFTNGQSDRPNKNDESLYQIDVEDTNISFQHIKTDMKVNDGYLSNDIKNAYNNKVPRRTKSHDISCQRKKHIDHIQADCLSIKKLMRSHSYELAVYENSWIPTGKQYMPILKFYNHSEDEKCYLQSSEDAYENKAYDKHDNKNTYYH